MIFQGSGARMAEVSDRAAALVLTSPPYFPAEIEPELVAGELSDERIDALESRISRFAATLRPVFDECARVLRLDGVCILQTRDVRLHDRLVAVESIHRLLMEAAGFVLYSRQIWWPAAVAPKHARYLCLLYTSPSPRD